MKEKKIILNFLPIHVVQKCLAFNLITLDINDHPPSQTLQQLLLLVRIFHLWEKALMRSWESESLCNPLHIFLNKEDHLCGRSSPHWVNHLNLVYLCLVWLICLYFSNNSFFHCLANAFFVKKEKWTHFPQLKKKLLFSIRVGMEVSHENRNPKSKKSTQWKIKS